MKKNIVFIIPSLATGGAEKSLINLLSVLDYTKFNVDIFLLSKKGALFNKLPKEVHILETGLDYNIFNQPFFKSCFVFLRDFNFSLLIHRILFTIKNTIYATNKAEQYSWRHLRKAIGFYPKKYDVAIGYLEKTSIYSCVDNFNSKMKIGFIRVNYSSLNLDKKFDINYFNKVDYLCANGITSLTNLKKEFPLLKNKLKLIYNVTLVSNIIAQSKEASPLNTSKINLVTIGRLHEQKGLDLAIKACKILVSEGKDVIWSIIGEGPERISLEKLIIENQLEGKFILLGEIENPYPYIAQANIYVQTSRYEGRSNTIIEAKILNKPIVVTNFETVFDQIINNVNGLIANKDASSIAENLMKLINDRPMQEAFVKSLSKNSDEFLEGLKEFYRLID